jgi:hypothetical protein
MKLPAQVAADIAEGREYAVLVFEESGDFYVEWNGSRTHKNLINGEWNEKIISGKFALVPVPETFRVVIPPQNG